MYLLKAIVFTVVNEEVCLADGLMLEVAFERGASPLSGQVPLVHFLTYNLSNIFRQF